MVFTPNLVAALAGGVLTDLCLSDRLKHTFRLWLALKIFLQCIKGFGLYL